MPHQLLYGGTFDPIHHGHLIVCRQARELLHGDVVRLIPANISPHKPDPATPPASGHARRTMLELAIADALDFRIDARELSRSGPSYTVETVEQLRHEFPADTFTLLIGADQLAKLETWHRFADLAQLLQIAVLPRPATDIAGATAAFRGRFTGSVNLSTLATPQIDISATNIRQRVAAGLPISFLVPPAVDAYIRTHNLYC